MRKFVIDTDTASDDAVALIMALRAKDVEVKAITVVSGNVSLAQATRNALYTAELCGATNVPIYAGVDRPHLRAREHADWFHGADGLGDQNYPPPRKQAEKMHAVDALLEVIHQDPGIELVTLGPLSNIALACLREPELARSVSRCVIMGGNPCCEGNVTPAAEYNIWCDPEAARIVFRSGMPIEMVGWQLCRAEAVLDEKEISAIRGLDTELARFAIDCNSTAMNAHLQQTGERGIALPDPVAMAVAVEPAIATDKSAHRVEIECDSELTRGMTVVDRLNVSADERNRGVWQRKHAHDSRASVVWSIDIARFKQLLVSSLS
jgi:purine nucleosidase